MGTAQGNRIWLLPMTNAFTLGAARQSTTFVGPNRLDPQSAKISSIFQQFVRFLRDSLKNENTWHQHPFMTFGCLLMKKKLKALKFLLPTPVLYAIGHKQSYHA